MRFQSPWYLILIPILLLMIWLIKKIGNAGKPAMFVSDTKIFENQSKTLRGGIINATYYLRYLIYLMIIISLSRPQSGQSYHEYITEGIDIMLAIDASGSMMAEDFNNKNRLEVAKEKVGEFIKGRKGDRIGIVVFGEDSFTLSPLTSDYAFLLNRVNQLKIGIVPMDKTAIGLALANSLNRLKLSKGKSKIIILLTDGMNNTGKIDPLTSAEIARTLKIKIYTIGIGKEGYVRMPVKDPLLGETYAMVKTEIDEKILEKIAEVTGGQYFRATNEESLSQIYKNIDQMEKTKVEEKIYTQYNELFPYLVWPALILLMVERMLSRTYLRVLP